MTAADVVQMPQPVCTTSEAARRLGVSSTTVQVMVERGELKAWRTRGGHRRISVDSVESIQRQRGALGGRARPESSTLSVLVLERGGDGAGSCVAALRAWEWPLQVLSAADGLEALLLIERRRPDIVIIDLELPDFDGAAFLRSLRTHHEFDAVQVIVLAGSGSQGAAGLSTAVPGVAVYRKPVPIEKLQGFVEANLLRHSLAGVAMNEPARPVAEWSSAVSRSARSEGVGKAQGGVQPAGPVEGRGPEERVEVPEPARDMAAARRGPGAAKPAAPRRREGARQRAQGPAETAPVA